MNDKAIFLIKRLISFPYYKSTKINVIGDDVLHFSSFYLFKVWEWYFRQAWLILRRLYNLVHTELKQQ